MGIYRCPRCGNPNGWWSGNMQDVHDCPGPPLRQWPDQPEHPPKLDWSELDAPPHPCGVSVPDAAIQNPEDADGGSNG